MKLSLGNGLAAIVLSAFDGGAWAQAGSTSAPSDAWKQRHDDGYYRNAVERQRKK